MTALDPRLAVPHTGDTEVPRARHDWPPTWATLEETAAHFEFTEKTIRQWLLRGCPVVQRGGMGRRYVFDLQDLTAWRVAEIGQAAAAEADRLKAREQLVLEIIPDDPLTLREERRTAAEIKQIVDTEQRALALGIQRRAYVKASDVEREWNRANLEVRNRVRAIPDRLAELFQWSDDQTEAALRLADEALTELADWMETLPRVAPDPAAQGDLYASA